MLIRVIFCGLWLGLITCQADAITVTQKAVLSKLDSLSIAYEEANPRDRFKLRLESAKLIVVNPCFSIDDWPLLYELLKESEQKLKTNTLVGILGGLITGDPCGERGLAIAGGLVDFWEERYMDSEGFANIITNNLHDLQECAIPFLLSRVKGAPLVMRSQLFRCLRSAVCDKSLLPKSGQTPEDSIAYIQTLTDWWERSKANAFWNGMNMCISFDIRPDTVGDDVLASRLHELGRRYHEMQSTDDIGLSLEVDSLVQDFAKPGFDNTDRIWSLINNTNSEFSLMILTRAIGEIITDNINDPRSIELMESLITLVRDKKISHSNGFVVLRPLAAFELQLAPFLLDLMRKKEPDLTRVAHNLMVIFVSGTEIEWIAGSDSVEAIQVGDSWQHWWDVNGSKARWSGSKIITSGAGQ